MLLYPIALFVHIIATMTMFAVIGIVIASVVLMRRTETVEQLRVKVMLAYSADKLMPGIMLFVLVPAIYMVFASWGWTTAWINTALIALVLASPLGPIVNTRRLEAIHKAAEAAPVGPLSAVLLKQLDDRVLWASVCTFTGVLIGIVFLMTVKPGLLGSLATIIVALVLGFSYSMVSSRVRS